MKPGANHYRIRKRPFPVAGKLRLMAQERRGNQQQRQTSDAEAAARAARLDEAQRRALELTQETMTKWLGPEKVEKRC
jgi:hypothetical protein